MMPAITCAAGAIRCWEDGRHDPHAGALASKETPELTRSARLDSLSGVSCRVIYG